MTTHLDSALMELARAQHGLFTTTQAQRCGMSPQALSQSVRSGVVLHPAHGLYAVASLVDPTSPEQWHQVLCFGASLLWDDASLTSTSAVLAHGVTVWGADLARVPVLRPIDRTVRRGVFRVRRWRGQPVASTPWGPAVELSHALAQHAVDHGIVSGVASADRALHSGLVTPEALRQAAEVLAPFRHGSRAMAMVAFADGLRESVGESRCAVVLTTAGLIVDAQVEIRDSTGHLVGRADFVVRGTNVIVEFDGRLKYDSGDPGVLWAEKKREDALRRLGYVVVRLTWADLERPGAAAAKVRSALAAA
ncbi:MAG: type IV toxin-antitoxin system AbiEi family antitoxin domain-containing protein [Knoellia sp.]